MILRVAPRPPIQPNMRRSRLPSLLALAALAARLHGLGGPYFHRLETVFDHVSLDRHRSIEAILTLREAARIIPPGVDVAVIRPAEARRADAADFGTAVGLLPRNRVVSGDAIGGSRSLRYVIAIGGTVENPFLREVARVRSGAVYEHRRPR